MKLHKDKNHSHYWIGGRVIYETYRTIRGFRYRSIGGTNMPDTDKLTEEQIKSIEEQLTDK